MKVLVLPGRFFDFIGSFVERKPYHLLCLLLALFFLQGYTSARQNSVTVDEFAHLPAGLSYWKTGDFAIYHHNPPLIKLMASVPLLFSDAKFPEKFKGRWELGHRFMRQNRDQYHTLFTRSRVIILLLALMLAFLLFRFARETLGTKAALFSAFLLTFSPNLLAHSYIVSTDLGATLAILLALYTLWKYLDRPSLRMLFICGLTFGLAQLTKFTSLILIPAFPMLMTLDYFFGRRNLTVRRILLTTTVVFIIGVVVINAGYLFEGVFRSASAYSFKVGFLSSLHFLLPSWCPLPFPEDYLMGLDTQMHELDNLPVPTYLLGVLSSKQYWYYFPVAFLLKTPILILITTVWATVVWLRDLSNRKSAFLFIYLSSFIALYIVFFAFSAANIGIRYFLPIYPILFLLSGYALKGIKLRGKIALCILSLWFVIGTVLIYPHHLSYFNEFAGGAANGHRYLADSNLDWGQDLISLKKYMTKNDLDFVYLSHFGLVDPSVYGIKYRRLPSQPVQGTVAISVNHLLGISPWKKTADSYKWLRDLEISDRAGYSIFIYQTASTPLGNSTATSRHQPVMSQ